jgi:hypothetical protein
MIRCTFWRRHAALPFVLILVSGCGYGNSDSVPVKGTVTFDGQKVDGGAIVFVPEGEMGTRLKRGGPIVDGAYALPAGKGPLPGLYRVEITWNKKTGKQIDDPGDPGNLKDETVQVIPAKYNTESKEKVEVKTSPNTFDFALKSSQ